MSGIVCAIRGGEESQPTIAEAVRVALENDIPIIFLYVVNLDFMTRTSSSRVHTIKDEMHDMGEFILIDARTKAKKQGAQAEGVIRDGKVGDEIIALCNERDADFVIIGTPREEREENVFTQARLRQFVERIEKESGAKVILVQGSQA
jgi:nucleotide-binding universal stress UspA family protein